MADKRREALKRALKGLRHPLLDDLAGQWAPSLGPAAPAPLASLADVPGIKSAMVDKKDGDEIDYIAGVRETSLAKVSDLFAKSAEAVNASSKLVNDGAWLSAVLLQYDGCFYLAKACCHLLGFTQYSQSGTYIIDIFPEHRTKKGPKLTNTSDKLKVHVFGRWEHLNVWHLLGRLAFTAKGRKTTIFDEVKKIDFDRISDRRNAYVYDCRYFGLVPELSHLDVPSDNVYDLVGISKSKLIAADYDDAAYYHLLLRELNKLFDELADIAQVKPVVTSLADSARHAAMAA